MPSIFRRDCDEGGLFKFTLRQKGGIKVFLGERCPDEQERHITK